LESKTGRSKVPRSLPRSYIWLTGPSPAACEVELLPTIRSYVKLRQSIHAKASQSSPAYVYQESEPPRCPSSATGSHGLDARVEEATVAAPGGVAQQQPENEIVNYSNLLHKEEDLDVIMEDVSLQEVSRDGVTSGSRFSLNLHSAIASSTAPNSPSSPDKPSQCASARTQGIRETDATVPKSVPFPPRPKPKTTRELLTRISFLTAELLRASEEKVGLATAAYDNVRLFPWSLNCAEPFKPGRPTR
jgi:hypothetical protein